MIYCDVKICAGCRTCEVACTSFHYGAVSPALSRIRVAKLEEAGLDMAVTCLSCLEKPCLDCPNEALSAGEKGVIVLDAGLCDGCEECVDACPIGAVGFHDSRPLICDLCNGATACVTVCPSRALAYREDYTDIPLETFLSSTGKPSQKRARYVRVQGAPLRESWKKGVRVDS